MHREQILRLLDSYQFSHASDQTQLEKVRRFVQANPRCFERSLAAGHLTGSAWIVSPDRRRVLLTHHHKLNRWLQLGGHADGNPDILAVALREAEEESGLRHLRPLSPQIFDIDVHGIPANPGMAGHFHYDIRFIFEADPGAPLVVSHESKELAWVALAAITKPDFDWSIRRMVQKTAQFPPTLTGRFVKMKDWTPPADWLKITTIDSHTGGEPFRVITGGFAELPGDTILARRRYAKAHLDHLRTALMFEPRGHADMYGCIVTPPVTPEADIGILFMHNEGYSTMCGHGIIAITKVVLETGYLPLTAPETTIKIDTPAGLVTAHARISGGQVQSVHFHNVPSFVLALDETVEVPGLGRVRYDIAFGGAFYAYVQAAEVGLSCTPADFRPLIETGMAIKRAVMAARPLPHPFEADLSFLYGTIFIGPPLDGDGAHSRNVCIFAEGEVDRCPTGTGVSGRLAIHYARGEIGLDEPIIVESIIGSRFTGRIVETTTFGPHPAIIPEVEGTAHITGRHEFLIDPADPLRDGFILR